MDGMQIVKAAKQRNAKVVVLVLTGYGDMQSAVGALHLAADDCIQKQCDTGDLVFRMNRCLDKKDLERTLVVEKANNDSDEMATLLAEGCTRNFNYLLARIMGAIKLAEDGLFKDESPAQFFTWAVNGCIQVQELTPTLNQVSDMYRPKISVVPAKKSYPL